MFYWLIVVAVLAGVIILFYVFNYYDKLRTVEKNLERIKTKWGRPVNSRRNFKMIAAYLNGTDDPAKLSPAIGEDLDLNNIFNYIDRTNSKPGKQVLYKKLFTPVTSFEELFKFDKKIESVNFPRPDLERIELDISNLNSPDAYNIADLFLERHELSLPSLMALYIRVSWLAIVGLAVSLFIEPAIIPLVVLIALLIGNIALHYGTRN